MSTYIHIPPPFPVQTVSKTYRYKELVSGSSIIYTSSQNPDEIEIDEGFGIELVTTLLFDLPTSHHISLVKYQWSLDNTNWNDYISDNAPFDWYEYIDQNNTETSNSDDSKDVNQPLVIRQYLNVPDKNYNKPIYVRLYIQDFFGIVHTRSVISYKIKYSNRAWFHTESIVDEPDSAEIPLDSIPAEKAYAELSITYMNSDANTYVLTIGSEIIIINDNGGFESYDVDACIRFFGLINQSALNHFDISRNGTIIKFTRKIAGLNPIPAFQYSVTFSGNITYEELSKFNGTNEISFRETLSDGKIKKVYYTNKSFVYTKSVFNNFNLEYSLNGTSWFSLPYDELNDSIQKSEVLLYGSEYFIRYIDNTANRISNTILIQINDINYIFFESLNDTFENLIENEINYTEFDSLNDNFTIGINK